MGSVNFYDATANSSVGRPPEQAVTLVQDDPTWKVEYEHFKSMCQSRAKTDLSNDIWLRDVLAQLEEVALEQSRRRRRQDA